MEFLYESPEFAQQYTYTGSDLGALYRTERTAFRVWSPTAESVSVRLYRGGDDRINDFLEEIPMQKSICGTWTAEKSGDLSGVYYTYAAILDGKYVETCDPYARTTGVNGTRAMVIDLAATDPDGWDTDRDPHEGTPPEDMILYEAHIRDLTMHPDSGIEKKGKFLGVIEQNTHTSAHIPTGLSHIVSLGITHVHFLPFFDYGSVDERDLDTPQYNWGYDPKNFNVPEGSYATDPFDGAVRVRELKQMVKGLHDAGLSIVMDVVYNHVYEADRFCFNKLVPMYFSRRDASGALTNDSFCGNDTASERPMVRKYIIDSVTYWAREYHIDGFRFDLVGLIDAQTIREVMQEVHRVCPNVIFYGEGWDMYTGKPQTMATQKNAASLPGFAFFNDTIRDTLRGATFFPKQKGFVSGRKTPEELLYQCYCGAPEWATSPIQSVNYVSCHDNNTLFDRIAIATPNVPRAKRIRMNCLAAAFYLTAQGIPFLQAGEEFLRSKPLSRRRYDENSYRSPDSVNAIRWDSLERNETMRVLRYYRGLIALRRHFPILRSVEPGIRSILPCTGENTAAFQIGDDFCVIFNADDNALSFSLPHGEWDIYAKGLHAGCTPLQTVHTNVTVEKLSAMVLKKRD